MAEGHRLASFEGKRGTYISDEFLKRGRRKHLMCKKLPVLTSFSESDTFCSEEELTSILAEID
ncbi:hypothetical protein Prudu_002320 [Prunus dulcis]|uniref:Uncharacterized protein n=1 Tax=Prunus dulcis TaxID=3755 RepID=A0A4Y1QQG7_PRUDU|nr:hypothetical protein Prudu_002320 [Prunus dulcis]